MSYLAAAPFDTLSRLCEFLTAQDVAKLWLTGNTLLLGKLKVSVLRFALTISGARLSVAPPLLSQFINLRSLLLKNDLDVSARPMQGLMLEWLPKSVTELDWEFAGAPTLLAQLLLQPDLLPSLAILRTYQPMLISESTKWPAALTSLKLELAQGMPLPIALLPPGLTELNVMCHSVVNYDLKSPTERIPTFSSLVKLKVRSDEMGAFFEHQSEAFFQALSSLRSLVLITDDSGYGHPQEHALIAIEACWLPRTLTKLRGTVRFERPRRASDWVRSLPPSLTDLRLMNQAPAFLVDVDEDDVHKELELVLERLPKGMKKWQGLWPRFLCDPLLALLLPRSLISLGKPVDIEEDDRHGVATFAADAQVLAEVPPGMETMGIRTTHLPHDFTPPPSFANLPLKRLFVGNWPVQALKMTPHTLQELDMCFVMPQIELNWVQALPRFLVTLYFEFSQFGPAGDEIFEYLPRTLKRITMFASSHVPHGNVPRPLPVRDDSSKSLPPSLTSFSIGPVFFSSNTWLQHLPQSLTEFRLMLSDMAMMTGEMMTELGARLLHLSSLNLYTPEKSPADGWGPLLKYIPRQLVFFSLHNEPYEESPISPTDEEIQLLPPHLSGFDMPFKSVDNQRCWRHIASY